jgi:hypothetical protein
MICGGWLWGDMEGDGMHDVCCVVCDVPMWVGIDGGYVVYDGHAMGTFHAGDS